MSEEQLDKTTKNDSKTYGLANMVTVQKLLAIYTILTYTDCEFLFKKFRVPMTLSTRNLYLINLVKSFYNRSTFSSNDLDEVDTSW